MKTFISFLLGLAAFPALAAEPFAKATIDAQGSIVPGQQVRLTVDVLAPGFFTSPPDLPLFGMRDALVTLPQERAQNLVQTVAGVQYSGIRRRYAIVPEKFGRFTVPSISIAFGYSIDGNPSKGNVMTEAISFDVSAADNRASPFSARDVEISQSFDRDPTKLKAGDVLSRTIIVTAKDTQALLMPPVDVGQVDGIRQYLKQPKLEDGVPVGRGDTLSRRTETMSYTTNEDGKFLLPAVRYPWFDLDTSGAAAADLPAVTVAVATAAVGGGIVPELQKPPPDAYEERKTVALRIGFALLAVSVIWMMRRIPAALLRQVVALRQIVTESEWYRLKALRKTILTADLPQVYSALQRWASSQGYRTLSEAVATRPELASELPSLEAALFSGRGGRFDRRRAARVISARSKIQRRRTSSALPPLNPGG